MKRWLRVLISLMIVLGGSGAVVAGVPPGDLLDGVPPGPDGKIDVLTIFAHQDDEAYAGGTLLKLRENPAVRLHLACLTLGDMSEARYFLGIDGEYLGRIRAGELLSAAAVYGAVEVIQLDYHDQGLKGADQEELTERIVELINSTGAEVVITHDPSGLTRHPDHVTCSAAVTRAFPRSSARRLYYATYPLWLYLPVATITPFPEKAPRSQPTIKVDIRGFRKLKLLALYEHASQKHFSFVGLTMEGDALLPWEWFCLAGEQ